MGTAQGRKPYYTKRQVKRALRKTGGMLAPAARLLAKSTGRGAGHRDMLCKYVKRDPSLQVFIDQIKEGTLDTAEHKLFEILKNDKHKGQLQAVTFYLQTMGKRRGYVKRQEMTGQDGAPIQTQTVEELDLTSLSDKELAQLDSLFAKAATANSPTRERIRPRLNGQHLQPQSNGHDPHSLNGAGHEDTG